MTNQPCLTDAKTLRERARKPIEDDPVTRRMLEDILATEQEHADDLVGLLSRLQS